MERMMAVLKRLFSVLLTTGLLAAFGVPQSGQTYAPTPGEPLAQTPFYCNAACARPDDLTLGFNAVYRYFGGVDDAHSRVYRFGNEAVYFEWMAQKLAWTRDRGYVRELKDKIVNYPQTDNGYLWSWSTSTYWPTGKGGMHYDGLFRFVAAVAELLRWDGSPTFLGEQDKTTLGSDRALDASEGRTVYEKCRLAMQYAEENLFGKSGIITLTEASVFLADGKTRFDVNEDGENVWNNTGRPGSTPSNYWDNLPFGHKDAYETALYYHALCAMHEIELLRGNEAAAAHYETVGKRVKKAFDCTFWNPLTGRYIACVDADGKRWDPGLTFLNTEALCYGLGNAKKAKSIFAWLDGKRPVPGDSLQGKAILDYAGVINRALGGTKLKKCCPFVPVTNTVSIEKLSGLGEPWWFSPGGAINTGYKNNAFFGKHLENGGYIFYTLFYELAARLQYCGANSVGRRAKQLSAVYRLNGFDSDVGGWVEGLTGEYPESGIVSRVFLSGFAGVSPKNGMLEIRPHLPCGVKSLGVEALQFAGVPLRMETTGAALTLTAQGGTLAGTLRFVPAAAGDYRLTLTAKDGTVQQANQTTDSSGALTVAFQGRQIQALTVTPAA